MIHMFSKLKEWELQAKIQMSLRDLSEKPVLESKKVNQQLLKNKQLKNLIVKRIPKKKRRTNKKKNQKVASLQK